MKPITIILARLGLASILDIRLNELEKGDEWNVTIQGIATDCQTKEVTYTI